LTGGGDAASTATPANSRIVGRIHMRFSLSGMGFIIRRSRK
jgi:hypothetical protein